MPNNQAFSLPRVESNVERDSIAVRNVSANKSSASSRPTRRAKYAKSAGAQSSYIDRTEAASPIAMR